MEFGQGKKNLTQLFFQGVSYLISRIHFQLQFLINVHDQVQNEIIFKFIFFVILVCYLAELLMGVNVM